MDTLKITATANGMNYLAEYVADEVGLFGDAGLVVWAEAKHKDPWSGFLASKVWGTVAIDPAATTERWMSIPAEEGLVKDALSYDQLVDESFMESYR